MLGYIVGNQFFWDEAAARAYSRDKGEEMFPTVPDLIPKLAKGEVVCYEFCFVDNEIVSIVKSELWKEPEQTGPRTLWLTAVAEDLEATIKLAKSVHNTFAWKDYDE